MQTQNGGGCSEQANSLVDAVAIAIPVLNEAAVMPRLLRLLGILDPAPAEIIAVDGGSQDNTAALVRQILVLGTSGTNLCLLDAAIAGKQHTHVGRLKQSDQNTQFSNELVSDL